MFCTNCRTIFDWNTGKIDTGVIHNPHFYEEERRQLAKASARKEEDNCYYTRDYWNIQIRILKSGYKNLEANLNSIVDNLFIINYEKDDMFKSIYDNKKGELNEFQQLRVKYILNDISEEEWRKQLLKLERKEREYESVRNIYKTLCDRFVSYMVHSVKYFHRNMNSNTPSETVAMDIYNKLRSNCIEAIEDSNKYLPKRFNITIV